MIPGAEDLSVSTLDITHNLLIFSIFGYTDSERCTPGTLRGGPESIGSRET